MKTHSRVQYHATLGGRQVKSAQAKTMKGWIYKQAMTERMAAITVGVRVVNIHTQAERTVYVRAGMNVPETESIKPLLDAKKGLGA